MKRSLPTPVHGEGPHSLAQSLGAADEDDGVTLPGLSQFTTLLRCSGRRMYFDYQDGACRPMRRQSADTSDVREFPGYPQQFLG
jgi:hypothetical protein